MQVEKTNSRTDSMEVELPEGWSESSVGTISAAIQYGYTASALHNAEGPRFLRITDIQDGVVNWGSVPTCEIASRDFSKFELRRGDIVFARTGATTGKCFLIRECPSAVFASYLIRLRPHDVMTPNFLYLFFQSPNYWTLISENVSGNAQPNCNASKLANLPLPVPPFAEQTRIVEKVESLLARVNASRERLGKVPAILKRFRQAVLAAACSGRLTADWREKNTPDDQKGNGLDLPKRWTLSTIGQVSECLDNLRRPINKEERMKRVGTVPYYGANGQVGVIDTHIFNEPLVLVVEDETFIGREIPFTYKIAGKSWVNNHAHVLRATKLTDIDYLNYSLMFYPFTELTSGTTGRRKLTKGALLSAPYVLPPLDEQQEIVQRLEKLFKLADAIEKRVTLGTSRAEKLTQAILAKAFRGELVPIEAELARQEGRSYESAAELLKRIQTEKTADLFGASNGREQKPAKKVRGERARA